MIVCLEKFLTDAEERGNAFFLGLLEKQHVRLKGLFDRRVVCNASVSFLFCLLTMSLVGRPSTSNRWKT